MFLFILAYLGGAITIVSPCILPVLPFVFARADQPFLRSGLPMLVGMAGTFAIVVSLAAVGGGWVVAANDYGRLAALALMALFGIALLLPELSGRLTRPLVAAGRPPVPVRRCRARDRSSVFAVVAPAWHRNGPAGGTVRRAGAWPDPY